MKIKDLRSCFCGSGKAFRSCCKGKVNYNKKVYDDEVLNNPKQINNIIQKKLRETDYKICFHPDKEHCKKPIKNAHTLQNNGVLSIVSEKNNVRVTDLLDKIISGNSIKEIRRKNATTFYGFCEYHDSVVFSEIENICYEGSEKQNLLHAYRTCAQEYHKKNRVLKVMKECFKDNPSIYNMPYFIENYTNTELAFNDVETYMNIFNKAFENDRFDIVESYVYKFDKVYDFAVTTMFNPTYDLEGKLLNDIYSKDEERLKSIFVSVLPTKENSYMIISYLKEDTSNFESYINQIKK